MHTTQSASLCAGSEGLDLSDLLVFMLCVCFDVCVYCVYHIHVYALEDQKRVLDPCDMKLQMSHRVGAGN